MTFDGFLIVVICLWAALVIAFIAWIALPPKRKRPPRLDEPYP